MLELRPSSFSASGLSPEEAISVLKDPALEQIEVISGSVSFLTRDTNVRREWIASMSYSTMLRSFYLDEICYPQQPYLDDDMNQYSGLTSDLSVPHRFEGFKFQFPYLISYGHSRQNNRDFRRGPDQGMNYTNEALRQFIRPGGDLDILLEREHYVEGFGFGFETRETDDGRASEGGLWYESEDEYLKIWMGRVMTNSMYVDESRVALIRQWFRELEERFKTAPTEV